MNYTQLEEEIVARLQPLIDAGHEVVTLPETQEKSDKPFPKTRVIVGYSRSEYTAPKSTAQIIQDETIYIHVSIWARKLRGNGFLYAISDAVRILLVGFMPTDCNRMYLDSRGVEEFEPGAGIWARNLIFKCTTRVVEDFEDETGPLITQITIDENPDNPGAVVVPPPDTWPPNPPSARIGDTSYWNGEVWVRLAPGEEGQVLTTNGIGEAPSWEDAADPTESDPIFTASAAYGIQAGDITHWNAAYGWGNHAGLYALLSHTHTISNITGLQSALDGKSAVGHTHTIADIDINADVDFGGNKGINVADPVDDYDAVNKKTLDSVISETNVYDLQGSLDCSTNPDFPAAVKGMRWEVNVAGKIGGAAGIDVEEWDEVVCSADNAGGDYVAVGSSWYVVKSRVLQAEEDYSGTAELATNAETQAGSDDMRIVTPLKLSNWWEYVKGVAQTFAAKVTFTLAPRFSSVTANHVLTVDGSKDLTSEAKGTAFNKDFGTGTTNVPAIGSTLGNSLPVATDGTGKLTTVSNIGADVGGTNDWVDYSSTSTIVGWSSYVYKSIWYQKRYKAIDVRVYISGTSNSASASVTLPFAMKSAITPEQMMVCRIVNNGTGAPARCYIGSGSNVLVFNATIDGAGFIGFGTKAVYIDFTLPID